MHRAKDTAAHTLKPAVTLAGGFQNPGGSFWGRPVDAVPGPDGALYVSDDAAGAVYRLAPGRRQRDRCPYRTGRRAHQRRR